MTIKSLNPGNINVRLGMVLNLYEQACYSGEIAKAATMIDIAASYIGVHLKQDELAAYDKLPGFAYGDNREGSQVFADLDKRLRYILRKAREHNVFARYEMETNDADELDQEDEVTA